MRNRSVKSVKDELIKKSREAMLAAVQIYNTPQITFKAESYITLTIISWTYLLHAYYRKEKIEYKYYHQKGKKKVFDKTKYGAYKYWELERCLNEKTCPLDNETKSNLRFLIGIRHEIEHQMTKKIDEFLSAKLQACAINYNFYIISLFGAKYNIGDELALVIQFSPLSTEQRDILQNNSHIATNVRNFIIEFENNLPEEALCSPKYAYRVLFTPISVNRKGQADSVIEFIPSNSPLAEGIKAEYALIKETEKRKYLPKEIVEKMKEIGYEKFTIRKHTDLWKGKDAKNPKYHYGVKVSKTWYWYDNWLKEVGKYCKEHADELKL